YLARNNQQAGPYTLEQLNQMLANQQVMLTDLAWHQGMAEWKALGELTQGKSVYQPEGYVAPTATPDTPFQNNPPITVSGTQPRTQATTQKNTLASIPSRILAKIVDVLLWLPATFILTGFFTPEQDVRFAELNQEFMNVILNSDADPTMAQQLQTQMLELFSQQAWIATAVYLLIMLVIQAYLLAKYEQIIGKNMNNILNIDAYTTMAQQLQSQMFQMVSQQPLIATAFYLLIMLVFQAYPIAKSGQSIGKKMTKIKIVDVESGEKVSLLLAFTIRSVFFIFLNIIFMPLSLMIDWAFGLGKKRQTLHDKLAKTQVVKQ